MLNFMVVVTAPRSIERQLEDAMPKEGKDHSFSGSDKCQICGMSRKAYDDMGQPCRGPYPAPPIPPDKPPTPRRDKTRARKSVGSYGQLRTCQDVDQPTPAITVRARAEGFDGLTIGYAIVDWRQRAAASQASPQEILKSSPRLAGLALFPSCSLWCW